MKPRSVPTTFTFRDANVRTVIIDRAPWFVAGDVAEILGYRDAEKMARNLDDDEKGTQIVGTLGGRQSMTVINESGLYSAVLTSRRPEAKAFKRWVTGTVLPSLRKHGGYIQGQETLPEELLSSLHKTIRENALPALRYYDKRTEWSVDKKFGISDMERLRSTRLVIEETALKFDLPVSFVELLTRQGLSALETTSSISAVGEDSA